MVKIVYANIDEALWTRLDGVGKAYVHVKDERMLVITRNYFG